MVGGFEIKEPQEGSSHAHQNVPNGDPASGGYSVEPPGGPHAEAERWTVRRVVLATLTALLVALAFFLLYRFYMVAFFEEKIYQV